MRLVLAMVLAGLVALAGCGEGNDCTRRLSDYGCVSRDSCPTYDELLELGGVDDRGYPVSEPTPCGDTEFIVWGRDIDGGGLVLYFDEAQNIVAAEQFGYDLDDCGGQILYGPVPSCPEEQWWRNLYCVSCR